MKKRDRIVKKQRARRRQDDKDFGVKSIPEFTTGEKLLWKGISFTITKFMKKKIVISPMKSGQYLTIK